MSQQAIAVFLDGEISGTPAMLRAGKATVMLAGDEGRADRVASVLGGFASSVNYVGAFGNAARIKLITNYLVGVHTLAAAEALLFAGRLGLDQKLVVDTIAPSAGGSTMLSVRGRMMAERQFGDGTMRSFMGFFDRLRREQNAETFQIAEIQARQEAEAKLQARMGELRAHARAAIRERLQLTLAQAQDRVQRLISRAIGETYRQTLLQMVRENGGRVIADEQTGSIINMELELY